MLNVYHRGAKRSEQTATPLERDLGVARKLSELREIARAKLSEGKRLVAETREGASDAGRQYANRRIVPHL